ncbi:MAG: Stp1/IreP family PP2C-type Ser/Thr phosphatase [Myxococcota bacterium]
MTRLDPRQLESTARTDVGVVRHSNQDACGESASGDGAYRVFVVADGMGGHAGGETASRIAVETVEEAFGGSDGPVETRLRGALETANRRVHEEQLRDSRLAGMGTTGVALGVGPEGAWVANVGDSRLYRLRSGSLEQLTSDHSVVAELTRRGFITPEQALTHPRRNEVLRSLGTEPAVEVDVDAVDVAPEDLFLLCSDGLCGVVAESTIASLLALQPLEAAAKALVDAANDAGGPDNVTVQIVRVPPAALGAAAGGRSLATLLILAGAALLGLAVGWAILRA